MAVARVALPTAVGNNAFEDTATVSTNTTGGNFLLVWLFWNDTSGTIEPSSVTFNGSGMTQVLLVHGGTAFRNTALYRMTSPTETTANVVATWNSVFAAANRAYAQPIVYSGVDTGSPIGTGDTNEAASGQDTTSASIATSDNNGLFSTGFCSEADITTLAATGAGHSLIAGPTEGSALEWTIGEVAGNSGGITPGFSWTNSRQHTAGFVPIQASGGGGGGTSPRPRLMALMGAT